MAIQGGCLCGKVRYAVTGLLFDVHHCHCSMCRRQHGAAFATYGGFNAEDFEWISGEDLIRTYETESGAGWSFCSECGSTLAGTDKGEVTAITLGTIQGDVGTRPESHIFVGSKAQWYEINDGLQQFDEWPKDRG
ncbi:MAG: GFA family protein [Pseudomonadota bacterium]